jgi:hypothetical protein
MHPTALVCFAGRSPWGVLPRQRTSEQGHCFEHHRSSGTAGRPWCRRTQVRRVRLQACAGATKGGEHGYGPHQEPHIQRRAGASSLWLAGQTCMCCVHSIHIAIMPRQRFSHYDVQWHTSTTGRLQLALKQPRLDISHKPTQPTSKPPPNL